jgi:hypothetical protein
VLLAESQIDPAVNCCTNRDKCNIPAYLQDGLSWAGNLSHVEHDCLDFVGVTTELDAGRPVGVRIQWPDGGGHFLLIDGYREFSAGAPQVHVADPYYGPSYVLYSNLVKGYQDDGIWTDTFFVQPGTSGTDSRGGSNILVIGPIIIGS